MAGRGSRAYGVLAERKKGLQWFLPEEDAVASPNILHIQPIAFSERNWALNGQNMFRSAVNRLS